MVFSISRSSSSFFSISKITSEMSDFFLYFFKYFERIFLHHCLPDFIVGRDSSRPKLPIARGRQEWRLPAGIVPRQNLL
jgi:hypothetical protein